MKVEFRTAIIEKPIEETAHKLALVKRIIEMGVASYDDKANKTFVAKIEIKDSYFTVKFFYENERDFVILPYEFFDEKNSFYTILASDYVKSKTNEMFFKEKYFNKGV